MSDAGIRPFTARAVQEDADDPRDRVMRWEFRAGDEPATSRQEYWQHVAGQALGSLELRPLGEVDGRDRIVAGSVGALRIGEVTSRYPGGAIRTQRHVRRTGSDLCKIDIPVDGGGLVEQDGRQAVLRPGDFTLVDLARPARWQMAPRRVVAVIFPAELFPLRPDQLRRLTAVGIAGDRGSGALVSTMAARAVEHLGEYTAIESARLGTAVLDLVGSALAGRLDADTPVETRERVLALRVSAYIEKHLRDPGLSPGSVAAANHLSIRALHRLFESRHATVAAWIRQRRLERARADLVDPTLRDRPVGAIGARWGMPNPSQFNRSFRAAFGAPPARYRDLSQPEPRDGPV